MNPLVYFGVGMGVAAVLIFLVAMFAGAKPDNPYRWHDLAKYNAERGRGIVHTDEWKLKMKVDQGFFDREQELKRDWND